MNFLARGNLFRVLPILNVMMAGVILFRFLLSTSSTSRTVTAWSSHITFSQRYIVKQGRSEGILGNNGSMRWYLNERGGNRLRKKNEGGHNNNDGQLNASHGSIFPLYSTISNPNEIVKESRGKSSQAKANSKTKSSNSKAKNKKHQIDNSKQGKPYKLVIVESPSKCKTLSKLLHTYATNHALPYTFQVDSCMGHVRDLPQSVKDVPPSLRHLYTPTVLGINFNDNRYEPLYVLPTDRQRATVKRLQQLSSDDDCVGVILATDEDREGEAIAWHLSCLLQEDHEMEQKAMERVTFHEITPRAIEHAFFGHNDNLNPDHNDNHENSSSTLPPRRQVDMDLVTAQETRRVLDRLAGYTISPLLWKKIAPGLSAGRVQSVGMSLVVQRERERMAFRNSEYWDLQGSFSTDKHATSNTFRATLQELNGVRLASGKDFDGSTGELLHDKKVHHLTDQDAQQLLTILDTEDSTWKIQSVTSKKRSNKPPAPFTTSTLQQESNKRLGFSVSDTMRFAQTLYEAGYITYMRTDSTHLSQDALDAIQEQVTEEYGNENLASIDPNQRYSKSKPKIKTKSKGATNTTIPEVKSQEAHEAIRPSLIHGNAFVSPSSLSTSSSSSQNLPQAAMKLYQLIYSRTLASYMADRIVNITSIFLEGTSSDETTTAIFRASGTVEVFAGYSKAWGATNTNTNTTLSHSNTTQSLPSFPPNDSETITYLHCSNLDAIPHKTEPPPRYTEASFVKELESLGVGRPSTYASVVQTLRNRAYVGSPVSSSSSSSQGRRRGSSWKGDKGGGGGGVAISAVRAAGGEEFMGAASGPMVPSLSAFVVCSLLEKHCPSYVDPGFTARMEERLDRIAQGTSIGEQSRDDLRVSYLDEYYGGDEGLAALVEKMDKEVSAEEARRANLPSFQSQIKNREGEDDDEIGLFIGPWGPYVQRIESTTSSQTSQTPTTHEKGDTKPKVTAALPQGLAADPSSLTVDMLVMLLKSREKDGILLGTHPSDGRSIRWKLGRYGAYLQWGEAGDENTTNHSVPKKLGGLGGRNINLPNSEAGSTSMTAVMPDITLEEAVGYVNLPREVCYIQDLPVTAAIGPYGPYLKYNNTFVSLLEKDGDVLTIDPETATQVVTDGIINKSSKLARNVLAELGEKNGSQIRIKDGRFGVYMNWKKVNVKIPKEYLDNPSEIPLEEAWNLISEKADTSSKNSTSKNRKKNKTGQEIALPPAPKRPKSAYLYFCAEKRPLVAQKMKTLGEVSKELARLWAETAQDETGGGREPYEKMAAVEKEEYEIKKQEWTEECNKVLKDKGGKSKSSSKLSPTTKKTAKTATKTNGKRSPSAYMIFCSENRERTKGTNGEKLSFGDIAKKLGQMWKECDEETRSLYQSKAEKLKQ